MISLAIPCIMHICILYDIYAIIYRYCTISIHRRCIRDGPRMQEAEDVVSIQHAGYFAKDEKFQLARRLLRIRESGLARYLVYTKYYRIHY